MNEDTNRKALVLPPYSVYESYQEYTYCLTFSNLTEMREHLKEHPLGHEMTQKEQETPQPTPLTTNQDIHALFHNLWSRDVGTEGYNKKKWTQLDAHITHLEQKLKDAIQHHTNEYKHRVELENQKARWIAHMYEALSILRDEHNGHVRTMVGRILEKLVGEEQ